MCIKNENAIKIIFTTAPPKIFLDALPFGIIPWPPFKNDPVHMSAKTPNKQFFHNLPRDLNFRDKIQLMI